MLSVSDDHYEKAEEEDGGGVHCEDGDKMPLSLSNRITLYNISGLLLIYWLINVLFLLHASVSYLFHFNSNLSF